jgi:hypothetical protein
MIGCCCNVDIVVVIIAVVVAIVFTKSLARTGDVYVGTGRPSDRHRRPAPATVINTRLYFGAGVQGHQTIHGHWSSVVEDGAQQAGGQDPSLVVDGGEFVEVTAGGHTKG